MSQKKTSIEGWKARSTHEGVTLPSGAVVSIRIPNLPLLAKTGRLPNELVQIALELGQKKKITQDDLEQQVDLTNTLVSLTVIEPALGPDDVPELPFEDQEMVVEFALRMRDLDAVYHHLGGLETIESFRDARSI